MIVWFVVLKLYFGFLRRSVRRFISLLTFGLLFSKKKESTFTVVRSGDGKINFTLSKEKTIENSNPPNKPL